MSLNCGLGHSKEAISCLSRFSGFPIFPIFPVFRENRVSCVIGLDGTCTGGSAVNYIYDAAGNRVGKQRANILEDYVYDPQGHATSIYQNAGLIRAEIYTGSRHIATWNSLNSSKVFLNHADWLGTERVRTDSTTGLGVESCTDTPYGMNLNCTGTSDTSPMHFTGLQYDSETGMSHTLNRQYPIQLGRWLTPDPSGKNAVGPADPQTWNMYGYVRNNPTTLTDPTGLRLAGELRLGCAGLKCEYYQDHKYGASFGRNMFDAIMGVPGTYVTFDTHGNMGFGFSAGLWQTTCRLTDSFTHQRNPLDPHGDYGAFYKANGPIYGLTTIVTGLGTDVEVSGVLPEYLSAQSKVESYLARHKSLEDLLNGLAKFEKHGIHVPMDPLPPALKDLWIAYRNASGNLALLMNEQGHVIVPDLPPPPPLITPQVPPAPVL